MSGPVSQSESDVIHRRLQNIAKGLLDAYEEIQRLRSLNASLSLATNLDAHGGGIVTVAEASALFAALNSYRDWFENQATLADGVAGSNSRRARLDPYLVTENL